MLSNRKIETVLPTAKQFTITDGRVPGLKLRVSPSGTKTFNLFYRYRSKQHSLRIGRYPKVSLAEARERASLILKDIEHGIDPRAKRHEDENTLKTVKDCMELFVSMHVRPKLKSAPDAERILNRDIVGAWRSRDVRDITHDDVLDLTDEIRAERTISSASLAFRHGRKFFNWLIERRILSHSPFHGLIDPGDFKPRRRVLNNAELLAIWHATDQMGYPWGSVYRLLILTGKRRGEVATSHWADFDYDQQLWIVPGERTKKGEESLLPLTPAVMSEIQTINQRHDTLLFASMKDGSNKPVSGFSKAKKRLDKLSGVSDFRIHDIRRTVATRMAELGVSETAIERILDHEVRVSAVAPTYNRYKYLPEMREGLLLWNNHLQALLDRHAHTVTLSTNALTPSG